MGDNRKTNRRRELGLRALNAVSAEFQRGDIALTGQYPVVSPDGEVSVSFADRDTGRRGFTVNIDVDLEGDGQGKVFTADDLHAAYKAGREGMGFKSATGQDAPKVEG